MIAAADAGDVPDLDEIGSARILVFEGKAQLATAVQVAAHIIADPDIDADRRLEPEVRVEAGDGMHVLDGDTAADGDLLNLARGHEADGLLHVAEVLKHAELVAARLYVDKNFWRRAHPFFLGLPACRLWSGRSPRMAAKNT
jgi:hypothetical protein